MQTATQDSVAAIKAQADPNRATLFFPGSEARGQRSGRIKVSVIN
jgi:hypothetical protein